MKKCSHCGATNSLNEQRCWYCNADFNSSFKANNSARDDFANYEYDSNKDPYGYYATLGVSYDASAGEIKRGFRQKAKYYHPDRSKSKQATEIFQQISEAYQVLRDPLQRAEYDALSIVAPDYEEESDQETEPLKPVACSICGTLTAQPRYVIFYEVKSFFIITTRTPIQGIFCRKCADKKALRATIVTWLFGWWGIPFGPIYSIHAILRNLFGGEKPRDINARIIGYQAYYFASKGAIDAARSLAQEALQISKVEKISLALADLLESLNDGRPVRHLKKRWRLLGRSFFSQLAIASLIIVVVLFAYYDSSSNPTLVTPTKDRRFVNPRNPKSSPIMRSSQSSPGSGVKSSNRWYVTVQHLYCREGPGAKFKLVTILDQFETVKAIGPCDNELLSNVVYGALGSVPHFLNTIDEFYSTDYLS